MLTTGIVEPAWLESALPVLQAAADTCRLDGDELLHLDVRSDNLCFRADGSAVLVDWNLAVVGNARLDIAAWLPTLVSEGGPRPETILADAGREAAFIAGFFAARAGQPPVPGAPAIRPLQLEQLRHALPWVCRELGLPLP
jgi:aminoglycoside phosphotransferase (APT) family kinase protein